MKIQYSIPNTTLSARLETEEGQGSTILLVICEAEILRVWHCLLSREVKLKQIVTACPEQNHAEHVRHHFGI